jgi:CBS domain-containing protein
MRADQIMTPQVITIGADASIVEAIDKMLRHQVSGLPVVDTDGKLIGIISEGDFIRRTETGTQRKSGRWLDCLAGADRVAADFVREHGRKVGQIMTPDPVTVTEDTPLAQIVRIMESHNVKRLPVVRGDRLVGIVTRADFLPALAELARQVAAPSADDDRIRSRVIATIEQAVWRPRRLNVMVRDGIVSLGGVVKKRKGAAGGDRRCGKCSRGQKGTRPPLCLPTSGRGSGRRRLRFVAGAALNPGRRTALTSPMELEGPCAFRDCALLLRLPCAEGSK